MISIIAGYDPAKVIDPGRLYILGGWTVVTAIARFVVCVVAVRVRGVS